MTRSEALAALIAKVEAGEKHIGAEAAAAFLPNEYALACRAYGEWGRKTSLDAAVAFVEAVLPGWGWEVESSGWAMVSTEDDWADGNVSATPARALLLAALRALTAQEDTT